MNGATGDALTHTIRQPAVAGSFYPAGADATRDLVSALLAGADASASGPSGAEPVGLLVPHAGLVFSGLVAAAAWRLLRPPAGAGPTPGLTVIMLGTNHSARLEGIGAWDEGAWRTPVGDVRVDQAVAAAVCGLGAPFTVDRRAHLSEHSIEVQLPLLLGVRPTARVVPLAVSAGTGVDAIDAGARLGRLLAALRAGGTPLALAISTDMAHYPPHEECARTTEALLPPILDLEPAEVAARERACRASRTPGLLCGMCGIEPAVLGLAALRELGALRATRLASATSADAGGPPDRTVGYLAIAWHDRR